MPSWYKYWEEKLDGKIGGTKFHNIKGLIIKFTNQDIQYTEIINGLI